MSLFLRKPRWIDDHLYFEDRLDNVPAKVYDDINDGLERLAGGASGPLVSVVIPALNEELTILRTLQSLSRNQSTFPTEIVVVNNNSTDRTQEVLDRLRVQSVFQEKAGWGPARQLGQERARGKYILMADADCFYPPGWIQRMTRELQTEGVTCVYGGYKFLPGPNEGRWKYALYESLRGLIIRLREYRRPWLNAVGMCMGYVRELGLQVGFVDRKIRGEDGRMAFELAQLGRIRRVASKEVIVWTFPRTLQRDGSLIASLLHRALKEIPRFRRYFMPQPVHDTHNSPNSKAPVLPWRRPK